MRTSGLILCIAQTTSGTTKKLDESAPHRPTSPFAALMGVSCWHGEPATTKRSVSLGRSSANCLSLTASFRSKSHASAATLLYGGVLACASMSAHFFSTAFARVSLISTNPAALHLSWRPSALRSSWTAKAAVPTPSNKERSARPRVSACLLCAPPSFPLASAPEGPSSFPLSPWTRPGAGPRKASLVPAPVCAGCGFPLSSPGVGPRKASLVPAPVCARWGFPLSSVLPAGTMKSSSLGVSLGSCFLAVFSSSTSMAFSRLVLSQSGEVGSALLPSCSCLAHCGVPWNDSVGERLAFLLLARPIMDLASQDVPWSDRLTPAALVAGVHGEGGLGFASPWSRLGDAWLPILPTARSSFSVISVGSTGGPDLTVRELALALKPGGIAPSSKGA